MISQLKHIFAQAIEGVKPSNLIRSSVRLSGKILAIKSQEFDLSEFDNIYIIGFGKASIAMGEEIELLLQDKITDGVIIGKEGQSGKSKRLKFLFGTHPVPSETNLKHTQEVINLLSQVKENDLVITLISGGGSALLFDVPNELELSELMEIYDELVTSGASIHQINSVRKALSGLKGGGLLHFTYPAKVISLIISDVVGDDLSTISSGPTCLDEYDEDEVKSVIDQFISNKKHKGKLFQHLGKSKFATQNTSQVDNILIGTNMMLQSDCKQIGENLGYKVILSEQYFEGSVEKVLEEILSQVEELKKVQDSFLFVAGGESQVKVSGTGLGGRTQHIALLAADKISARNDISVLCVGTDGNDGPTDAAGAAVDGNTKATLEASGKVLSEYFKNFDTYHYFQDSQYHLLPGSTGTNVMDVVMVLFRK